jgi:hypothetical protein
VFVAAEKTLCRRRAGRLPLLKDRSVRRYCERQLALLKNHLEGAGQDGLGHRLRAEAFRRNCKQQSISEKRGNVTLLVLSLPLPILCAWYLCPQLILRKSRRAGVEYNLLPQMGSQSKCIADLRATFNAMRAP